MLNEQIAIAGFGGQGVQLIGQLLTYAGMREGRHVSYIPSYGAEMRGGSTNCNVIISQEPVGSPLVTEATAVIVFNGPSLDKFEGVAAQGGALFINSSMVSRKTSRDDVKTYYIPAGEIAQELGNERVANMVMLGAYIAHSGAVSIDTIMAQLTETFGERRAKLLPVNRTALERGAELVK